jgi:hypothetical protein
MRKSYLAISALLLTLSGCTRFVYQDYPVDSQLKVKPLDCRKINPDSLNFHDYQEALKYAPILSFTDKEEYFPTLPFFSAFDGVDNNGNGLIDFADPQEIAPRHGSAYNPPLSLDSLHAWYGTLPKSERKKIAAVFYKIDSVPANKLGRILFSDEQAWLRLSQNIKDYLRDSRQKFKVYLYFFYYIFDQGLRGHPEDLEYVINFVPEDTNQRFGILLGAGHMEYVPNSVLIYLQADLSGNLGSHLQVLVELGGHSHAPDLNANRIFDPGVDVNWHTENFWGTRDIQAIAGQGATAKYQTWMTFPRVDTNLIYPPDTSLLKNFSDAIYVYRLVPAEKFKTIDLLLTDITGTFRTARRPPTSNKARLLLELDFLKHLQLSSCLPSTVQDPLCLERMTWWTQGGQVRYADKPKFRAWGKNNHKPWKHSAYSNTPDLIFKSYLFRPRKYGGLGLWGQIEQSANPEIRLAWITPAWAWRLIPMKVDGVTEIHFGWRLPANQGGFKKERWITAFYYERYYARIISWYANLTYVNNLAEIPNLSLGGGVSSHLPFVSLLSTNPVDLLRWIQLRAGIRTPVGKNGVHFHQAHLEIQLGMHY